MRQQAAIQAAASDKLQDATEWLNQQRARLQGGQSGSLSNKLADDLPSAEDELLNFYSRTTAIKFADDRTVPTEKSLTQLLDEVDQMADRSKVTKTLRERDEFAQYDFGYRQRQQMSQDIRNLQGGGVASSALSTFQSLVSVRKGGNNTAYAKVRRGVKEFSRTGDSSGIRYMVNQMYDMGMTKKDIREIMGITFNKAKTPRYIGTSKRSKLLADVQSGIISIATVGNKTAKDQSFRLTDVLVLARNRMSNLVDTRIRGIAPRKKTLSLQKSILQSRPLAGSLKVGIAAKMVPLGSHAYARGVNITRMQEQEAEIASYRAYDSVSSETHSSEGTLSMGAVIGIAIAASITQEVLVESATSMISSKLVKHARKRLTKLVAGRTYQKMVNQLQSRMGVGIEVIVNMTEFLLVAAQGRSHVDRYGNAAHGNFSGLAFAMDQLAFPAGTAHGIKYAIDLAEANAEQRSYVVNAGHMARDFSMMTKDTTIGHAVEASRRPVCRDEQRLMRATATQQLPPQADTMVFTTNVPSYRHFCRSFDLTSLTTGLVIAGSRTLKLLVKDIGAVRDLQLGDHVHITLPHLVSGYPDEACFRVSEKTNAHVQLQYVQVASQLLLQPDEVTARLSEPKNLGRMSLILGSMFSVTLVEGSSVATRVERPHWFGKFMYATGTFSVGTTYSMVVDLAPGRVRLSDLFEHVRREMMTELMNVKKNDAESTSTLMGTNGSSNGGRLRIRDGTIQTREQFDVMTVRVDNATATTTFAEVGRRDYIIAPKSGDPTRVRVRRLKSDRIRVYRSGSDRAQLLVAPPSTTTSETTSTYSVAVRPLASRVAWSSPRMYSDFDAYRVTDITAAAVTDEYMLTVDRSLPDHLVGSTVHVGDTSDATLVRWIGAASSDATPRTQLVVRLPRHDPIVTIRTKLQRNATETDATVTTLVVTDASGITTGFTVLQAQITSVNVVDGTVVLDRRLDTVPKAQTELTFRSLSLEPTWVSYRGPRNSKVVLTRGSDSVTVGLDMSLSAPIARHAAFQDAVLVEACGEQLRMRTAADVVVTGMGWELEVPTLSLNGCILVPTLRMRGSPPGELQSGDVVRFPGEKVARRVLQAGNATPTTTGDKSHTVVSQSSVPNTTMRSLTLSEAVPASVTAHVWRVVLPTVEQCTFPVYSIDDTRTTVVVGDLRGMWPGATSSVNVNFYDPTATTTASARETVLSNARLPDGHDLERLPEGESHAYPQVVVGSTETHSLARATLDGWSGGSGLAARCAWHVDMASYKDALEVSTPELTRLLLRNARLTEGIGVQPLALRRGGELATFGAALLDRGSPQVRGLCSRTPLVVLSAGPRLEDPHMGPTRFPAPTSVRCVGPTIWRLEWTTGFRLSASAGEVVFLTPRNVAKASPMFEGVVRTTVRQSSHLDIVPRVSPVREDQVGQDPMRVNLHAMRDRLRVDGGGNTYSNNKDSGFTLRRFVRPRDADADSATSGWIMRRTRPPALRVWRNLLSGVETRADARGQRMVHRPVPPVAMGVRLTQGFTRTGNRIDIVFPGAVEAQGAVEAVFFLGSDDAEQRLLTSRGSGNFLIPTGAVSDNDFAFGAMSFQSHGTYNYPEPSKLSSLTASSVAIVENTVQVTFDWLADTTPVSFIEYVPTCNVHLRTSLRRITHFRIGARQTRDARVLHADPELNRAIHTSDFVGRKVTQTRTNRALYPNLRIDNLRLATNL